MIKFNGRNERGRLIIGLGISELNVLRMKSGQPIHIHADELGFEGEIVIFYGETEDKLAAELRKSMAVENYTDRRKEKKH